MANLLPAACSSARWLPGPLPAHISRVRPPAPLRGSPLTAGRSWRCPCSLVRTGCWLICPRLLFQTTACCPVPPVRLNPGGARPRVRCWAPGTGCPSRLRQPTRACGPGVQRGPCPQVQTRHPQCWNRPALSGASVFTHNGTLTVSFCSLLWSVSLKLTCSSPSPNSCASHKDYPFTEEF